MARLTFALALGLLLPLLGRADDDLARFAARNRLAVQKLTAEVDDALTRARALERTDPAQARVHLEQALAQVRAAEDTLTPETRARLTAQLQTRLRAVAELVRAEEVRQRQRADAEAARATPRTRPAERTPGSGSADIAGRIINDNTAQRSSLDRQKIDRDRNYAAAIQGVQDSSTPIRGDLEFGKDHARRMEIRAKTIGSPMTGKEVALLKALNSTLTVDFKNHQFRQVLDYLGERTGIAIIPDAGALRDAMVEYEDPITFAGKNLTVRTILRKVLADRGLAYILKEGTVQVVTPQRARETMTTRTYPIDDLVGGGFGTAQFGPFFGQIAAQQQRLSNAQGIVNMIQNTIEPSMWSINGGPATISYFDQGSALIVRAPAEMHYMLGSSFTGR